MAASNHTSLKPEHLGHELNRLETAASGILAIGKLLESLDTNDDAEDLPAAVGDFGSGIVALSETVLLHVEGLRKFAQ